MSVTQYIGARYVPLFADPIEWSSTNTYEPLTIVTYQGNSYTSRQSVPAGLAAPNDASVAQYWAITGNYNAQIEQYRQEVRTFDGRITTNANGVATLTDDLASEVEARENADTALSENITNEASARQAADTALNNSITMLENDIQTELIWIGDSFSVSSTGLVNSIANALKLNAHNYAVSGCGYLRTYNSSNFSIQADNAIRDFSDDADKVAYVFIYGGVNDMSSTVSEIESAANTIITKLKAKFTNARILIIGVNTFVSNTASKSLQFSERLGRAAMENGCAFIDSHLWGVGREKYFANNGHPNALGYRYLTGRILSSLFGSINDVPLTLTQDKFTLTGGTWQAWGLAWLHERLLYINCGITLPEDVTQATITLPYGLTIEPYLQVVGGLWGSRNSNPYFDIMDNGTAIRITGTASTFVRLGLMLYV